MVLMFNDQPGNYDQHGVQQIWFKGQTLHYTLAGSGTHVYKVSLKRVLGVCTTQLYPSFNR